MIEISVFLLIWAITTALVFAYFCYQDWKEPDQVVDDHVVEDFPFWVQFLGNALIGFFLAVPIYIFS